MARVQGIKEKVHAPLYDALFVKPPLDPTTPTFVDDSFGARNQNARLFRFFMDVQGKTKLETNLQSAGVLPSLNTFEARALRVVVSTLDEALQILAGGGTPISNATDFANEFVFNSVTSLLVGEKVMIEMPTYWFPSGSGVVSTNGTGVTVNNGFPDPMATFRFAEPVYIEPQQNFRVEILFPNELPAKVANAIGPLRIWVVLDGYLTRDAQ